MRKTIILTALAVAAAALCSCSQKNEAEKVKLDPEFSASLSFEQADREFRADFSRHKDGSWQMEFTEPETVEGLTFTQSGEVISVSQGELRYIADPSQLGDESCVKLIAEAADKLCEGKSLRAESEKKGVTTMVGKMGDKELSARIKKGRLLGMEIGDELSVSVGK